MIKFNFTGEHFTRGSPFSAGYDVKSVEGVEVRPGERATVATGAWLLECPVDCYLRVAPRSGLAHKFGINVLAGVIDSDYRGEIKVILHNTGSSPVLINKGDRIAQLVPTQLAPYGIEGCDDDVTMADRGSNGFGSSGV